jgi:hypothetical protein
MINTIDIQNFLSTKQILCCEKSNYDDAFNFLIENENNTDIITYENTRNFLVSDIDLLEKDESGNSFYELSVRRDGEIIDNIHYESSSNLEVQISYYIGGVKYTPEEVNQFIFVLQYNEFRIRITFLETPTTDVEFKIFSRYYIMNMQPLNQLEELLRQTY